MVTNIHNSTINYVENMPKHTRKSIGQFFTPPSVAKYMGELVNPPKKEKIRILDAGAGAGVLTAAVVTELLKSPIVKYIEIDLYENNKEILPVLLENMQQLKEKSINIGIDFNIIEENFITYNANIWNNTCIVNGYDIVVSNPPYKKINKDAVEACIMSDITYGQPNLYFLFMAMAVKLLLDDGELIFIVPRSWTSGLYFRAFRHYFFDKMSVEKLHIFTSRDKVFKGESVLQETIIIKAKKTLTHDDTITITTSNSSTDIRTSSVFTAPYNTCIKADKNYFLFLPSNSCEVDTLNTLNMYKHTLEQLGFKLKTGITVDFRSQEWLKDELSDDIVPIFWAFHFNGGVVHFPKENERNQYISIANPALLMENKNYLFLKRFTSKEEKRRLQPAIFLAKEFTNFPFISTENHINFITALDRHMSDDEVYGLYVLFNSTLWDQYYRILNGSTQVNATEINSMLFPELSAICFLGKRAQEYDYLSTEICDNILRELDKYEKGRSKTNTRSTRYATETAG